MPSKSFRCARCALPDSSYFIRPKHWGARCNYGCAHFAASTLEMPPQPRLRIAPCATIFLLVFAISHSVHIPTFTYIGGNNPSSKQLRVPAGTSNQARSLANVKRLVDAVEEATIAYFIQVSDSSLPLTLRLLARLHHPHNIYAVHFDKKIPAYLVVRVVTAIKQNPIYANVHIMEREQVTYRGVTMVLNNMAAASLLLQKARWDYFINLSGSDYPLVSPVNQRKFLAMPYVKHRASNFFIVSPRPQWDESKRYRFEQIAIDTALGMSDKNEDSRLVVLDEKMPLASKLNYEYVKGEGWLILTRDACKFMTESPYARKMLLSMAFSQEASEHFYVSLFWNHPSYNKTFIPHSLRTVYWRLNGVDSGQHPYVIDQLRGEDGSYTIWQWLRNSPHWFARKFSEPDGQIMDMVDDEMNGLGRNVNETAVQQSIERVENHLHWLYGILPKEQQDAVAKRTEDEWPSR